MKQTSLYQVHTDLGAKMTDFAGFQMPLFYTGVRDEHLAVRNHVGIFDVSHMGEFLIEGSGALEFIQALSANNAAKLETGMAQYTYLPNDSGGIIDDCILYKIHAERFMLVVNAANIQKVFAWLQKHNQGQLTLRDISDSYALLAVQGPKAKQALQSLTSEDLNKIPYYTFKVTDFAGVAHVILSATGYTGSGGFEIYCKNSEVQSIWSQVLHAGEAYGIQPIGLAARDTLRIEMGYCLYGNEITESTSPIAAGLGWVTDFKKKFTNSSYILKQKQEGTNSKCIGFAILEKGIPRSGYEIIDHENSVIGHVTSGCHSPIRNLGIGIGYVLQKYTKPNTEIFIKIRNKSIRAKVVKFPFVQTNVLS